MPGSRLAAAPSEFGCRADGGDGSHGPFRDPVTPWVSFVLGNPINANDPTGHDPCSTPTPGNGCGGGGGGTGVGPGYSCDGLWGCMKDGWAKFWGVGKYANPTQDILPSQSASVSGIRGQIIIFLALIPGQGEGLKELEQVRTDLGLNPRTSAKDPTVATLYIDGKRYTGVSGEKIIEFKVNAISKTHAEIDTVNQLFKDHLTTGVTGGMRQCMWIYLHVGHVVHLVE